MSDSFITLGIESSCDETSVALLERRRDGRVEVRSHLIFSQLKEHAPFGGIVPEVAARAHVFHLRPMLEEALQKANVQLKDIQLVAATSGPGLIGSLLVGFMTGRGLALGLGVPFIGVNHLAAHVLVPLLIQTISFPYGVLLVSGGHTQIIRVEGIHRYQCLATTKDDALGEAFDKVARLLGLGYPGGPHIEKYAQRGCAQAFHFPRPMLGSQDPHFSFSGLKTAVRQSLEKEGALNEQRLCDVAASFQQAVVEAVGDRVARALASMFDIKHFCLVGGVASNLKLRSALEEKVASFGLHFFAPPPVLCTDNAAMIAFAGLLSYESCPRDECLTATVRARWPLSEITL